MTTTHPTPTTTTGLTVTSFKYNTDAATWRNGWFARIEHEDGTAFELSQMDTRDETDWYVDGTFRNGLPTEYHGFGSRACLKTIADQPLAGLLEQLADAAANAGRCTSYVDHNDENTWLEMTVPGNTYGLQPAF